MIDPVREPPTLPYATPAQPQRASRGGCLWPLAGGLWVLAITMAVPISADRYRAPIALKLAITLGHAAAIVALTWPFRGKAVATWVLAVLVSLWATLQLLILWIWN
jgi:hypothetical protein